MKHRLNAKIVHHTGQPLEKIANDVERDYFMTADEALAYGIIDKIIKTRDEV
jgi:ATP-dependent Clp protease protease subunit